MKSAIAGGILAFGFLLLIIGALWSSIFTGTSSWTDEKANRSAEIKARLPMLGAIVNGQKKAAPAEVEKAKAEFDELTKENDALNAEFTSAAETPQTVAKVLKYSGIGLAIVGLFGWYATKGS